MFPMVTEFMNYGKQTIRTARYIGQSFIITLSHTNCLPVTIQYPYEKSITSERFRGRIHFEFDKCIACEVCVRVCPIDLPIVDWKFKKKKILIKNNCFIIVLILESVYFAVTVSSIVQQTVYR
uniref:NADH-plastoquinone oxidoreductase subunit I n=1 Tax=Ophrys sphegodes subsp. aveyronensis TaxID=145930 RepID=A0A7T0PLU8_OPHSP|nr:NADH-plastoquinone oxidoreductase subunit I [Ophrys sphegodes subsp. aveyronensis]